MMITKLKIRKMLTEAAESEGLHMTMHGEIVPFGCPDCVDDLDDRITDMAFSRDACNRGTAARAHYNGVLGDLRIKRRSALKQSALGTPEPDVEVEIVPDAEADEGLLRSVVATMLDEEI